ncbi:MAG: chemotaxis protein CheW [Betaproteobacteria bacterium]|nr:chemotaxis protein CheW [Betaproteobacteria bacterium]MDE2310755.1 chemotaxis protein CheW [Betaproteobacteria bacterium]
MSNRINLRQFQQQLTDRMQTKGQAGEQASALGIQIGEDLWLVEMSDISEVLPVPPITTVPFTKLWYCGVANVRGNLYSVVDLAAFMGQAEVLHDGRSRVLLVAQKFALNAGLLVNRVLGLRNIRTWRRSEAGGRVQYQDQQGQIWRQLNVSMLLKQTDFLHVES